MKASVILIESNTTGTGRLFAQCVRSLGYRPVLLAEVPSRYTYIDDGIDCLQVRTSEPRELREAVSRLAQETPIAGIYSSSEYFIEEAATLASSYGLPSADPVAVKECRNKYHQRLRLKEAGIPVPRFWFASSHSDLSELVQSVPLPVVVKPVAGSGSVGVRLCRTSTEVLQHGSDLLNRTVNERGLPQPSDVLIEEYLEGQEYSVEIFGNSVMGVTLKHVSDGPSFVEIGHDFPARLAPDMNEQIAQTALRAGKAMGLNWGPIHIEIKMTPRGPAIVEINPRLAGGFIPELVRLAYGIDLIRESVRNIVQHATDIKRTSNRSASIRFLLPRTSGRVRCIEGVEEARSVPGVVEVRTYVQPGNDVRLRGDFRDRIAHVIASGVAEGAAERSSQMACNRINIEVSS